MAAARSAGRKPKVVSRRTVRACLLALSAWVAIAVAIGACDEGSTRCSHDTDCDPGRICSNQKDQRADGVCVEPCTAFVGSPACSASASTSASASAKGGSGGAPAASSAGGGGSK